MAAKGNNNLQNNSHIHAKQDITALAQGSLSTTSATLNSTTGTIHLEAAKPVSLTASTTPSHLNLSSGSLSAAKNIVVLADNDIHANTAIKAAENLHLYAGKNLNLTINPGFAAIKQDIRLKAGGKAAISATEAATQKLTLKNGEQAAILIDIVPGNKSTTATQTTKATIIQNLNAGKNLSIDAGNIVTNKVNLKAASGSLNLTAHSGDITLSRNTRLNAGNHIEAAALRGNIQAVNMDANSKNGHVSILAHGDVGLIGKKTDYLTVSADGGNVDVNTTTQGKVNISAVKDTKITSSSTNPKFTHNFDSSNAGGGIHFTSFTGDLKTNINAKTGVYLGSVGKGSLKLSNADIRTTTGNLQLLADADITINASQSQNAQASAANLFPKGNNLRGDNITIKSNKGAVSVDGTQLGANKGILALEAKTALTLNNVNTKSAQNTIIATDTGTVRLNQINAGAGRHLAISSKAGQVLQNDTQNTYNNLKANGVLSIHSGGWHNANNSQMQGGAVHLKSGNNSITLGKNSTVKALSNAQIKSDTKLKTLDGNINIEAQRDVNIHPGRNLSADGNLSVKAGNKLNLNGTAGHNGNPSAVASTLTAKGEIRLIAGEANIQAAKILAGKDLAIATTRGQMEIGALRNTFASYKSESRHQDIRQKIAKINRQINHITHQPAYLTAKQTHDKVIKDNLAATRRVFVSPTARKLARERIAAAEKAFRPHQAPIQSLIKQKQTLEKTLSVLNQPGRGHEHLNSELSGQNINLISAQGINIEGAKITAAKQANLHAAGLLPSVSAKAAGEGKIAAAISISGLVDTFEYGNSGSNKYAYAIFNRPTEISAKEGVNIIAPTQNINSRLIISASEIGSANGKVNLNAYSDVLLTAGQGELYTYDRYSYKTGKWYKRKYVTEVKESKNAKAEPVILHGAKGINIKSGGSIQAYATLFDAPKGSINIMAANALKLYAINEFSFNKLDKQKKSRFLGIKYNSSKSSNSNSVHSMLPSRLVAESANTASGWDTLLQGTEFKTSLTGANIRVGVGENARKDAKIVLQGIKNTISQAETRKSNSVVWQSMAGKGSTIETLSLPKFEGPTPPTFSAPGGFIVDIPKGNLKTEIEKLAKQPEYGYLKKIQTSNNINWNQVSLAYDQWDYKQEGLTGAGAAIIVIIVTALTYGAGTSAAAGVAGSGAATTGAGVAAAGTAGATAAGTTVAAMKTAALTSLYSQSAIALINNKGNISKTLKDLGRSSTVKNLATAVVTAGVADKIGATAVLNNASTTPWVNNLTVNLANAGSSAVIGTAINGGSLQKNLESAILAALVQTAHGEAASKIKKLDHNYIAHKVAHAVAGCAAAAANRGKCQDGAIGAAVGEIVGEHLLDGRDPNMLNAKERQQLVDYSRLVAGSVSALAGGDVNAAANTATVAIENNLLKQSQVYQFSEEWKECGTNPSSDACQTWNRNISNAVKDNIKEFDNCVSRGDRACIARLQNEYSATSFEALEQAMKMHNTYLSKQGLNYVKMLKENNRRFSVCNSSMYACYIGNYAKDEVVSAIVGKAAGRVIDSSTQGIIRQLKKAGVNLTEQNIVFAAKNIHGKNVFLETGNNKSGLKHIIDAHGSEFIDKGIATSEISDTIRTAVTKGKIIGYQGKIIDPKGEIGGRPIYEFSYKNKTYRMAITTSSNGYIVGANFRN